MSRAPWVMPKASKGFPVGNVTVFDTSLGWRFPNPKMEALFPLEGMGFTAENLVDKYEISRADQDAYAASSQQKPPEVVVAAQPAEETPPPQAAWRLGDELDRRIASLALPAVVSFMILPIAQVTD